MRLLLVLGLGAALALLAGCGSTTTTVTTSVAPAPVVVPFVQGLTEVLAVKKVKGQGLVVRVVRRQHAGVPSGIVYDQTPAAGSHSPQGATVTISVSIGQRSSSPPSKPAAAPAHFYSPSGNIECVFTKPGQQQNTLNCGTFNNHVAVVLVADQATFFQQSWSVLERNHEFVPGHAPVLSYGSTWSRGGFTCRSASTGMTCFTNSTKHGFTIDRNSVVAYPKPAAPPPPAPPPPPPPQAADKDFAVQVLQIQDDGLGDIGGIARITNTASTAKTATFTFTFFQGGQIVGTAEGSADAVAPGQTVTVQLVSQSPMISGTFRYQFQVDTEF